MEVYPMTKYYNIDRVEDQNIYNFNGIENKSSEKLFAFKNQ